MAEVVKTALLYSKELFEKLASKPEILQNRKDQLVEEMIKICVNAKAAVVEQDLTEKNIRMQLNSDTLLDMRSKQERDSEK